VSKARKLFEAELLDVTGIGQLPFWRQASLPLPAGTAVEHCCQSMIEHGFTVRRDGYRMFFEKRGVSSLAGPIAHLALLFLLAGCLLGLGAGYSGAVELTEGQTSYIHGQQSKKPLLGARPDLRLTLTESWRESHPAGQVKQWSSKLAVHDRDGALLGQGITSVNHPLSINGIDFYQANWEMQSVKLQIGQHRLIIPMKSVGNKIIGSSALTDDLQLVLVATDNRAPLVINIWQAGGAPVQLATLSPGQSCNIGALNLKYEGATVKSGISYKYDPGIPVVFSSFGLLLIGASLVVVPTTAVWSCVEPLSAENCRLITGTNSNSRAMAVQSQFESIDTKLNGKICEVAA
jgi:cytochrome c biogenesis protein